MLKILWNLYGVYMESEVERDTRDFKGAFATISLICEEYHSVNLKYQMRKSAKQFKKYFIND